MSKQLVNREELGKQLQSQVQRIDDKTYCVKSLTSNKIYEIVTTGLGFVCLCPDHMFRGIKCKHIIATELSLKIREEVKKKIIEPIMNIGKCIFCKSAQIVKDGLRHNKYGDIQKFNCKDCKKYFTINIGFERMKHNPQGITTAMQLYFSGESLRNTAKSLELLGVNVSHQTIYNWIEKYTRLMDKYLENLIPDVSNAWRTDELYLKVKGNNKYLYALMDDETRFWIAQQVGNTKYTEDVKPLLKKGKELTGKRPLSFISDGARNFHLAYKKEFFTVSNPRTKHISHIRLQGDHNNNKMERLNGEIRDREKTMRGLKKCDSPILKGYQIFHNYIREHDGLNGKTPAEKCGIKIEGNDKWLTIIQNAKKEILIYDVFEKSL
jgi:putative transposase